MKIKLDYTFIFEPAETFATKSAFNDFLAKALKEYGMVAERVKCELESEVITNEMLIIEPVDSPVMVKDEKQRSIRQIKDTLTKKRDDNGRYVSG